MPAVLMDGNGARDIAGLTENRSYGDQIDATLANAKQDASVNVERELEQRRNITEGGAALGV